MSDDFRRLVTDARALGFEYRGQKRNGGHFQFFHPETGTRYTTACTPGSFYSWPNAIRDMEKISGVRLFRRKTHHYRFKKVPHLDLRKSESEKKSADVVDDLVARADSIRGEFRLLSEQANRTNAVKARDLLADFEDIRQRLAQHHRVIRPIF